MKTNIALVALFTLGLSQTTFAAQALVGTWKLDRTECKSGAPYKWFTGGFSGSLSSQVSFTDSDIKASTKFDLKYDISQSGIALKQIEDSKKQVEQMPDFPDKQNYLANLEKSKADLIEFINKYKDGISCEVEAAGSYSVNGSELSTNVSIVKSTCEGTSTDQNSKSQFEVQGNSLSITVQPEVADNQACPKGDSRVTFFSRAK